MSFTTLPASVMYSQSHHILHWMHSGSMEVSKGPNPTGLGSGVTLALMVHMNSLSRYACVSQTLLHIHITGEFLSIPMPRLHLRAVQQESRGGRQASVFFLAAQVIPLCCKVWEPLHCAALLWCVRDRVHGRLLCKGKDVCSQGIRPLGGKLELKFEGVCRGNSEEGVSWSGNGFSCWWFALYLPSGIAFVCFYEKV